jgi:hypothetical protein
MVTIRGVTSFLGYAIGALISLMVYVVPICVLMWTAVYDGLGGQKRFFPKKYWTEKVTHHEKLLKENENILLRLMAETRLVQLKAAAEETKEAKAARDLSNAINELPPEIRQVLEATERESRKAHQKDLIERIPVIQKEIEDEKERLEDAKAELPHCH